MIEFGDFFYKDTPLSAKFMEPQIRKKQLPQKRQGKKVTAKNKPPRSRCHPRSLWRLNEKTISETLSKLKDKVDPGKIDWGKAGYDFGEGFSGSSKTARSRLVADQLFDPSHNLARNKAEETQGQRQLSQ